MDDAAVAAALMQTDAVFLLEDDDLVAREATLRGVRGRESDDPAPDDRQGTALRAGIQKGDSSTGLPSFPFGGGGGT